MPSLTIDPPSATVSHWNGVSVHQLANPGASRLVFKAMSPYKREYRLKPEFGFVEPGAAASLEIARDRTAKAFAGRKTANIIIQFAEAPAADARVAFLAASVAGEMTLPTTAVVPP